MPTRVLIVDDSVFMRTILRSALSTESEIQVVGTAQNGLEGLKKILELEPDVVTLDIEMPGMDGLAILERVMKESPRPIVMISTRTQKGAQTTLDALAMGAVDYVAKPVGDAGATLGDFKEQVLRAVAVAARSNRRRLGAAPTVARSAEMSGGAPPGTVIAIGISAGGPVTLHGILPAFPPETPPMVITQHMPAEFTGPFAQRLDAVAQIDVKQAEQGDDLRPGLALIAPGSHHLRVLKGPRGLRAVLDGGPKVSGFRPSVDVMFESVAAAVGPLAVAVVMTGMGHDGADGVRHVKRAGGTTVAQDEATSVVYGMPKAAFQTGCVDRVEPVDRIPQAVAEMIGRLAGVRVG
jgi:two-component system chemotaxis response regulator CheB